MTGWCKQAALVGLGATVLLMVTVGYLGFNDVKHLVVDTSSKISSKARSSLPILHKFVEGTADKLKNLTASAVSSFVPKTIDLNTKQHISYGSKNPGDAPRGISVPQKDASSDNSTSQETAHGTGEAPAKQGPVKSCRARSNIVLFKMHKCSSSTVQNILFRFGEEHHLNFVLPPVGNYLGHSPFNKRYMIKFPLKEYNILCHHTVFNARGMAEVMPVNSIYTTILRNPVPMFESLFTYNNMAYWYGLPNSRALELFLNRPNYYYRKSDGGILHVKNPMLYGLGLPKAALADPHAVDRKIEDLKGQFDLVMITEYFDESLVLLRHLMCWELDDIVYFVHNARSKSAVKTVPPKVAAKIRQWNYGDVKLYESFNRTFWQRVDAFGVDRMKEEVSKLRERNQYYKEHCIAEVTNQNSRVWHPQGIPIDSFLLRKEAAGDTMCVRMAEPELLYTDHIRQVQKSRYGLQ
ncbi:galactose-3-O-sulfotransferase 2-like [Acanthaster planci]|uniref:Galactose-3-O-sulfotransferase 2-like n=1 Tax=Acanthaster planci TaxID=133434 RepID=A0A8B8A5R0_ACAPL|nr:galactose-3-O-sulfotransferase 2-like [Acanthaster planci]XP_022112250.1 galactose-3-O-sulfotransferase 2-like [Acanthaster planci]